MGRRTSQKKKTKLFSVPPVEISNSTEARLLLKNPATEHRISSLGRNNATLFSLINEKRTKTGKGKLTVEQINEMAKKRLL